MVYNATTWQTGDLITAVLMNNLESQYDTLTTDWGPFKFTSGSTTDILLYENLSTFTLTTAANTILRFNAPAFIHPSNLTVEVSLKSCSGGLGYAYFHIRHFDYSAGVVSYPLVISYETTSTNYGTQSSKAMSVFPGERYYISAYGETEGTLVKDIRFYGALTSPTTGYVMTDYVTT